jgi:hypothetical protein
MSFIPIQKYLLNCFILTIPVLIWNIALTNKLPKVFQPEIFWEKISPFLTYGENIFRVAVFLLTLLMPLSFSTTSQKEGLIIYLSGMILYFASWLVLIYLPDSKWSNSILGFLAPAYTPLFWLIGIGLIGNSLYFNLPYRQWHFISISIIFLLFHNAHALTIFFRTHCSEKNITAPLKKPE